jgi:hypothetical protein
MINGLWSNLLNRPVLANKWTLANIVQVGAALYLIFATMLLHAHISDPAHSIWANFYFSDSNLDALKFFSKRSHRQRNLLAGLFLFVMWLLVPRVLDLSEQLEETRKILRDDTVRASSRGCNSLRVNVHCASP